MNIQFTESALQDLEYWQKNHPKLAKKVDRLLQDILKNPFSGIGKPEPLKFELQGCWSRRITKEHRLVYHVAKNNITVIACRYHY